MLHYLLISNVLQAVGGSATVRVPPFPCMIIDDGVEWVVY